MSNTQMMRCGECLHIIEVRSNAKGPWETEREHTCAEVDLAQANTPEGQAARRRAERSHNRAVKNLREDD